MQDREFSTDGKLYYISAGSNTISILDTNTFKLEDIIMLPFKPVGLEINDKSNKLDVVGEDNLIYVIGAASRKILKSIDLRTPVHGFLVDTNRNILYVPNQRGSTKVCNNKW